jgi:hypothetical protein
MFIFFIVALTKIYKSRDGLAAVSSNTSIMSEVSNISKSSLPTSMSNTQLARQASVGSSATTTTTTTSSSVKHLQIKQQQQTPLLIQSKQFLQDQQQKNLTSNSATKLIQSTPQVKQQLSSSSRTHLGTYALSNHALNTENARKTLINPNENVSSSCSSSINNKTSKKQTGSINNVLSVNTINGNQTTVSSTNSSPSSTSSLNKMNKNELKLNKEIKRLEALCESRTKELSMLKLTLKDLLIKFDGISVAFKYLSCDVSLK